MFTGIDFETCLTLIGPTREVWSDRVVPAACAPEPNPRYRPEYDWMHAYEKSLKARIRRTCGRPLGQLERSLFGADGAISEALSNAYLHGHGRDGRLAIDVTCAVGTIGIGFRLRDQGPGFDVPGLLSRLETRATYFKVAGNGLRALQASPDVEAGYAEGGRSLTLLVRFSAGTATPRRPRDCPARP